MFRLVIHLYDNVLGVMIKLSCACFVNGKGGCDLVWSVVIGIVK